MNDEMISYKNVVNLQSLLEFESACLALYSVCDYGT